MVKVRFLFLVLLAGALALSACKCGEDEKPATPDGPVGKPAADFEATVDKLPAAAPQELAAWLPADLDLAILAARPAEVRAWLKDRPWWLAMRKSPLAQDLAFAGPLYRLATARHKLASMSPVDLRRLSWEELLATPLAIGLKREEDGLRWLLVKQVDLRVQALDRLAEVFAQMRADPRLQTHQAGEREYRSLELEEGRRLYYAIFSNLLLLSNDEKRLGEALARSGEDKRGSLAELELVEGAAAAPVACLLRPAALGAFGPLFVPGELWLGRFRLTPRPGLDWRSLGEPAEGAQAERDVSLEGRELAALLPADTSLVLARADVSPAEILGRLLAAGQKDPARGLAPLAGALGGQAALVWLGRESVRPLPGVALLLKLGEIEAAVAERLAADLFAYAFGRPAQSRQLAGDSMQVLAGQGLNPAFALVEGWLILASGPETLGRILAVKAGRQPSLADTEAVAQRFAAAERGLWYGNFASVATELEALMRQWVTAGKRFDADDVQDSLAEFFRAAAELGRVGGGWARSARGLSGALEAL